MTDLLNRRRWLQHSSLWLGGLLLGACHSKRPLADNIEGGSQTFKLTSPAFAAEAFIPVEFTCDGADRSPALSWEAPPNAASAKGLTLILVDPDAPNGPFIHWVLYDLPPDLRELAAGIPPQPFLAKGVQGKNDFGQYGYKGPCPPNGTHRYFFRLYAVDKLLDLPPGVSGMAVQAALKGHILAKAELMGRYTRKH
jgi:Raf kinase inhibitor-like YbhB/YbcL family protein